MPSPLCIHETLLTDIPYFLSFDFLPSSYTTTNCSNKQLAIAVTVYSLGSKVHLFYDYPIGAKMLLLATSYTTAAHACAWSSWPQIHSFTSNTTDPILKYCHLHLHISRFKNLPSHKLQKELTEKNSSLK